MAAVYLYKIKKMNKKLLKKGTKCVKLITYSKFLTEIKNKFFKYIKRGNNKWMHKK